MRNVLLYGFFYALAVLLWAVLEFAIGLQGEYIRHHEKFSYFFALPAVALLYQAFKTYSATQETPLTWIRLLKFGLAVILVATLLLPGVWYVFCHWIHPEFLPNLREYYLNLRSIKIAQLNERLTFSNFLLAQMLSTFVAGTLIVLVLSIIGHTSNRTTQALS